MFQIQFETESWQCLYIKLFQMYTHTQDDGLTDALYEEFMLEASTKIKWL